MSAPDLSGLERTLAELGLPGRKARVVDHDTRRGWWFRWDDEELRVSEKVLERCPPDDAEALLVNAVFERQRLGAAWRRGIVSGVLILVVVVLIGRWMVSAGVGDGVQVLVPIALGMAWGGLVVIDRARARIAADDATVAQLGGAAGAERLVRALNKMDTEEVRVGTFRASARPDIHKRAERLVARHALCSAFGGDAAGS